MNFADSSLHLEDARAHEFTFKFSEQSRARKLVPRLGGCPTFLYMHLTLELNPAEQPKENDEEVPTSTIKLLALNLPTESRLRNVFEITEFTFV